MLSRGDGVWLAEQLVLHLNEILAFETEALGVPRTQVLYYWLAQERRRGHLWLRFKLETLAAHATLRPEVGKLLMIQ